MVRGWWGPSPSPISLPRWTPRSSAPSRAASRLQTITRRSWSRAVTRVDSRAWARAWTPESPGATTGRPMRAYLDIVHRVIEQGTSKSNRTGVDAITLPGATFEHDMALGFPLLTTKSVPFRLVASELEF